MSRSDYQRPSQQQIDNIYTCPVCQRETTHPSYYAPPTCCGLPMNYVGESYPSDPEEWNEVRDTQDGEWYERGRW
jgi:hypothetical protein